MRIIAEEEAERFRIEAEEEAERLRIIAEEEAERLRILAEQKEQERLAIVALKLAPIQALYWDTTGDIML